MRTHTGLGPPLSGQLQQGQCELLVGARVGYMRAPVCPADPDEASPVCSCSLLSAYPRQMCEPLSPDQEVSGLQEAESMSAMACFQGHGEPLSVPFLLRSGQLAYGLSAACCAPAR